MRATRNTRLSPLARLGLLGRRGLGLLAVAGLLGLAGSAWGCDEDAHSVSGTITLAPGLEGQLKGSDTLFIVARPADGAGGPPLAVKRIVGMKFPLDYSFSQEDVLRPGTPFAGKVAIAATIKRSGMVGVTVPGDMAGAYPKNPVEVGARHVDFVIDQAVGVEPAASAAPASAAPAKP